LLKAAGLGKGSGEPNRNKVGTVTMAQVEDIARTKLPDLNCTTLASAVNQVVGTARSAGIVVNP
jgi:large subunit ribosomal protein L11